jgi:hypothetical protein
MLTANLKLVNVTGQSARVLGKIELKVKIPHGRRPLNLPIRLQDTVLGLGIVQGQLGAPWRQEAPLPAGHKGHWPHLSQIPRQEALLVTHPKLQAPR